jgi:hypothetical protein
MAAVARPHVVCFQPQGNQHMRTLPDMCCAVLLCMGG